MALGSDVVVVGVALELVVVMVVVVTSQGLSSFTTPISLSSSALSEGGRHFVHSVLLVCTNRDVVVIH